MQRFVRVQTVKPVGEQRVQVVFTNGETREIDLSPYIAAGPIFEPIRANPEIFISMRVEGGTIAWPNGADIDPDVLYYNGAPPWAKQEPSAVSESG